MRDFRSAIIIGFVGGAFVGLSYAIIIMVMR